MAMKSRNSPWKNPWVIGWIGLILVVLLVNTVMVYLSVKTSPGLVVVDYYDRGKNLEKTSLQRQAQNKDVLLRLNEPGEIRSNQTVTFRLVAVDQYGQPFESEQVNFFAYRPSDASADFSVAMREEGPGRFSAKVQFPLKGIWDLIVSIEKDGKEHNIASRISALGLGD